MTKDGLPANKYMRELFLQYQNQQEQLDNLVRERGKEELFIFNRYVLKIEEGKDKLAPIHRELCEFIEDDKKMKKLLLIPRGHLKSTLITIGYATQQIVKNQNIRILILNATYQLAVDFLTEIKRNLTSAPELIRLYGDLTEANTEWAQDRITLNRTNTNIKGPTVWAAGIDSNLTGSHPDLIIMDDVVSRDNTQTIDQIEKVKLRYKDALDLLEPGGQLIIIGTRWTYNDFYSWIMDKNKEKKNFRIMKKKAYIGNLETGQEFQALWQEKFTREELLERKEEKGSYEFSAQYLNDPISEEDATFKRENFQYYDPEEYRGARMNNVIVLDPAISEKKSADFTAIGVFGADQFQNHFVKELVRGHWKPDRIIENIFTVYQYYPYPLLIETVIFQKVLSYYLQMEMRRRSIMIPIIEKAYHDKSKEERIKALQPLYESKKVYHNKNLRLMPYFEEELLHFPKGQNDDMIDTFAMALDYLVPPAQNKPKNRFHSKYLY